MCYSKFSLQLYCSHYNWTLWPGERALELEREPGRDVERAVLHVEAARLVGVGARVLRVGGAAGGRLGAVRGAAVALRLGGPRREHGRLDRHRVLLRIEESNLMSISPQLFRYRKSRHYVIYDIQLL